GVATLLLIASPAGAFQVPQTREEFVSAVSAGSHGSKMETFVVKRGLDDVYRTFEARTAPCLDVEIKRTGHVGYVEHSSSDYNPTLKRVGPDLAEFTLQVVHRPRAIGENTGPGGLYIMAADLKRAGSSSTQIVVYRPSMAYHEVAKSLMDWA